MHVRIMEYTKSALARSTAFIGARFARPSLMGGMKTCSLNAVATYMEYVSADSTCLLILVCAHIYTSLFTVLD